MRGNSSMAKMKFPEGTPIFFYTMIDRIAGVVESAQLNESGKWIYEIRVGETLLAGNIPENRIEIRTIMAPPKFQRGDKVIFMISKDEKAEGEIYIVDPYGTFGQSEEPSYDILVNTNQKCLYKHIRESEVIGIVK